MRSPRLATVPVFRVPLPQANQENEPYEKSSRQAMAVRHSRAASKSAIQFAVILISGLPSSVSRAKVTLLVCSSIFMV